MSPMWSEYGVTYLSGRTITRTFVRPHPISVDCARTCRAAGDRPGGRFPAIASLVQLLGGRGSGEYNLYRTVTLAGFAIANQICAVVLWQPSSAASFAIRRGSGGRADRSPALLFAVISYLGGLSLETDALSAAPDGDRFASHRTRLFPRPLTSPGSSGVRHK